MTLGDCPQCSHSRCIDCDVKSHIASDAEIEEERGKVERYVTTTGSLPQELNKSESSEVYGGSAGNRGTRSNRGSLFDRGFGGTEDNRESRVGFREGISSRYTEGELRSSFALPQDPFADPYGYAPSYTSTA